MKRCRWCKAPLGTGGVFRIERNAEHADLDFCTRQCAGMWLATDGGT